jgi:hypothetical protein
MDQYKFNAILRAIIEIYLDLALFTFIGCVMFSYNDGARSSSTTFSLFLFVSNYFSHLCSRLLWPWSLYPTR